MQLEDRTLGKAKLPTAHLILIHGLNSTPQEFSLMEFSLRRHGISYDLLRVPGYTDADSDIPQSWQDWLDFSEKAINQMVPRDQPVLLGGLCMGGMIAAALVQEKRCHADGLVLLSPSFVYDGWGLSRWRHWRHLGYLLRLGRLIHIREREPYGIKNPKIRKWVEREMHDRARSAAGPSRLPLWALQQGEALIRRVRTRLSEIACPTLILHAREDEITRLETVQSMFDAMTVAERELIVLENSYHMITIDNDRQRVADEILRFASRFDLASSTFMDQALSRKTLATV